MTQRFEKAYNALYNSFMNNTLAKGTCTACAVGNIVADAMGVKIVKTEYTEFHCDKDNSFWKHIFITDSEKQHFYDSTPYSKRKLKKLTGYTWRELARVEYVFERNTKIESMYYHNHTPEEIMEDQFKGLMAVMDVLIELDEVKKGEEYKNNFKNKFCSLK